MSYASLMQAADRLWEAAWALDESRGDTAASEWAARKVRDLMREGRADDPRAVIPIAEALERRLVNKEQRWANSVAIQLIAVALIRAGTLSL